VLVIFNFYLLTLMRDILNRLFPGPKVPEEYSVKNINERISVGEGAPPIVAKAGGLMNYTRNGYGTVVMQEGDGRVDTVWSSVEKRGRLVGPLLAA
jgi:hypothetical protein